MQNGFSASFFSDLPQHHEKDFSEIIPGKLYLTGALGLSSSENCQKITHQLNVTNDDDLRVPGKEYMQISVADDVDADLAKYLLVAFSFIESAIREQNGAVVVNCHKGKSRSATVVLAFLMFSPDLLQLEFSDITSEDLIFNNVFYDKALSIVRKNRDIIEPNLGFVGMLYELDEILGEILKMEIEAKEAKKTFNNKV